MSIDREPSGDRVHRDRGAAEPARYALLGLLLGRPAHGYDLARHFTATSALGDVIRLSPSHLYALLIRLERDGLITGERQEAGNRPQRRVYQLTDAGRDAIEHWLDEPVTHPRDMRIDFPVKLFIARQVDAARASRLIERQRTVFLGYIARLRAAQQPADSPEDSDFIDLMRAGRIGRAQAALDWLDRCQSERRRV